ncbi:MAG: aminotransferase class I/II-fold pyridoxal phosphate-dependent enzyme [Leptospirales bacterium]
MSMESFTKVLSARLAQLRQDGAAKGEEHIISAVDFSNLTTFSEIESDKAQGPRYYLKGHKDKKFLMMNSNSYLGLSLHKDVIAAEEEAARKFGSGPGGVRFISGTYDMHIRLEQALAEFHSRESAMIYSSAYSAVLGVLPALIDQHTLVVSDSLNHNSIINALRLARPAKKEIYNHLDMSQLEEILENNKSVKKGKETIHRVLVITDGIFSMRGDYAPLNEIVSLCNKHSDSYKEGIISIADDSHGVGAFGKTGRGTEEFTGTSVDILIATLGKSFGVNGGYITSSKVVIDFLKETSPLYIYTNPITVAESAASLKSIQILDSPEGLVRLEKLKLLTHHFQEGLVKGGFETIPGEHPIVPLMVRNTEKTANLSRYLFENGILATGLNFPVVPKGDEEIRFQINANHTLYDIDYVLTVLGNFQAE